jgi:hypothetical protein
MFLFIPPQARCPLQVPHQNSLQQHEAAVRFIVVYGRSMAAPQALPVPLADDEPLLQLLQHPSFHLDALYVHCNPATEPQSKCQEVYNYLLELKCNARATWYLLELPQSARVLGKHLALLLAHSGQRQEQTQLAQRMYHILDGTGAVKTPAAAAAASSAASSAAAGSSNSSGSNSGGINSSTQRSPERSGGPNKDTAYV